MITKGTTITHQPQQFWLCELGIYTSYSVEVIPREKAEYIIYKNTIDGYYTT